MLVSIAIDSPIEERFDRIVARRREDDMDNIEQLKERDTREIGWGMGEAIAASDRIIENTLNMRDVRVYDTTDDKRILNVKDTIVG